MLDRQTVEESQIRLLGRIAGRDRDALAELYDQTAAALFSLSLRIVGDPQEAEEVIQDVFVQLWEKAATFDPGLGSPFHWALSIARNRCIDRLRARQRRSRVFSDFSDPELPEMAADTAPARPGIEQDEITALRSAVGRLPRDQQQAIQMAFFGGMSHVEIAQSLEEPLGTIKARIRRGMLKLREDLQDHL